MYNIALAFAFALIIHCNKSPVESEKDSYQGDFVLISLDPPLDSPLINCDTITAIFAYSFPRRVVTIDTVFSFDMTFKADTVIETGGFNFIPTRTTYSGNVKSRKWKDTLTIKCPLNQIIKQDIQRKPLEIGFKMLTRMECKEGTEEGAQCYCPIDYKEKYLYVLGIDSVKCW